MNVGEIIIKVKADNKDLDKQLKELESSIKNTQKELEKLEETKANLSDKKIKIGIEIDKREGEIENQLQAYYEIVQNREKYGIDTVSNAERIIEEMHEEDIVLQELYAKYDEVHEQIKQNEKEQENFKEQIVSTKQKAEEVKNAISMKDRIEEVNKSLGNTINKIVRWGLAIFGIQGAFNFIRSSMSVISQYDEQLASDIQYMKTAIAFAIEPVVRVIVSLMKELMYLVGTIAKAFGWDIFKNANKGLEKAVGSAKELRKQLAPFDEMNILSDTSSGGGGIGNVSPSFNLNDIPQREWMEKLADIIKVMVEYWRELLIVVGAFELALKAIKFSSFIGKMLGIENVTNKVKTGFALTSAGIGLLVGSITNLIVNWKKMSDTEKLINEELAVLGAGFVALGVEIQTGVSIATMGITAVVTALVGLVVAIGNHIAKSKKERDAIHDTAKAQERLNEAQKKARDAEDKLIDSIDRQIEAQKKLQEIQTETGMNGEELYKKVQDGTTSYKDLNEQQKEVYKAYRDLIKANEDVIESEKQKKKSDEEFRYNELLNQLALADTQEEYEKLKQDVIDAYEQHKISSEQAKDILEKSMSDMSKSAKKTFTEDIPNDIKDGLNPDRYGSIWDKFKRGWNNFWDGLAKKLSIKIDTEYQVSSSSGSHYSGSGKHGAKGLILDVPRLAMGGIVSMPGRGVPIGSAIIGERGKEAVLPLTDSQQMALLGEAIGRYITINAQMNNYMNGRLISRELQRVQNEEDFAYNR